MKARALVLLSGGLDSSTCLGLAVEKFGAENVEAVSVSYGQKHDKELRCAGLVADHYGVRLHFIDLEDIFAGANCSLLKGAQESVPDGSYYEQAAGGKVSTYVPFRNGLMLSAIASKAVSLDDSATWAVYIGVHSDDTAGDAYPDCTVEFVEAMGAAVRLGTDSRVEIVAPFVGMRKADVVRRGLELGVPYELTWSCYKGGEKQCGKCATCIDRKGAFSENGVEDPVPYEI